MKYNKTLALIPAILLAACGGDEQTINEPPAQGTVVYSFPADGQSGVSPKADLVLRFSHAVTDADVASKIQISDGSSDLTFTSTPVDGNRGLIVDFDDELSFGAEYTVSFTEAIELSGAQAAPTPNAAGPEGIQFSTRGSFSGIASLDNLGADFGVANMVPDPSTPFQAMNFSTFRLTMTQPVHPEWQSMGGVIELTDSEGTPVPATVLVRDRNITLDPCLAEEASRCGREEDILEAGATYTLSLRNLPSLGGGTLAEFSQTFTPRDTGPTVVLKQGLVDSGLNTGSTDIRRSSLNGEIINGVTLNSVLQGTAGPSKQTGDLFAELGFAPAFDADEAVPLRVPKGSLLNSSSLDVLINGRVPIINPATDSIQTTGDIKVTMVSDASGYLLPNPYTDSNDAPRHVRLFMDVSMNTVEAQPNASLSQDLLGVELVGIAIVEDGVLTIDALGMVEPNLLGQEVTDSTIAFRIQAATDAESQLSAQGERDDNLEDLTGPQLVSWMPGPDSAFPGDRDQMQRPGDPIVLNFDEPLDATSVADGIRLFAGSTALSLGAGTLEAKVDGTSLTLNPVGGLEHGVDYTVQISNSLSDMKGNGAAAQNLQFALPAIATTGNPEVIRSPIALTTYPGFPCVTENQDIANGAHGTCVDDAPDGTVRDQLPVMTMPTDRPIVVKFSQSMNLNTINPQSFVVEKIANPATPGAVGSEAVQTGRIEKNNQQIRFYPDQAWEVGATYRYTMRSAQDGDCASGNIICSENDLALQTDLLVDPADVGGPDLEIYFTGAPAQKSVFTPLRNLPIRDTNSNYVVDCEPGETTNCLEPFNHESDGNGGYLPSANSTKLTVINGESNQGPTRVGCSPDGADCPTEKFIYQTYGLDTEVVGPATNEADEVIGVRVLLYPTMLATSSATVIVSANALLGSDIESTTGPQILRMTYGTPTEDNPLGLVEGVIVEGPSGGPVFRTVADLTLDAPNLTGATTHDLYSKPLTLQLEGPINFFDDGRMQIEQRNTVAEDITVNATLAGIPVTIPLRIPAQGAYLNFLSNPIKEIPAEY